MMEIGTLFQRLCLFFVTNKIFLGFCVNPSPQMMSVVVNKKSLEQQDHIQIINPPTVLTDVRHLKVAYMCSKSQIVHLQIEAVVAQNLRLFQATIFNKSWKCSAGPSRKRRVTLSLDDGYLFRPDFLSRDPLMIDTNTVTIRAWILDPKLLQLAQNNNDSYKRAKVKIFHVSTIPPPYSRPPRTFYSSCESWRYRILKMSFTHVMFTCPVEQEVANLVSYPLALNGLTYGVYRSFSAYSNEELEYKRRNLIDKPRFTISVFLYVLEYCKSASLCSIIHHAMWNGTYFSPLLFITKKGNLHIQVTLSNGETAAALTGIKVPKHEWVRLAFVFKDLQWKLTLNRGYDFNETESTEFAFSSTVRLDDTRGLFVVGGSDYVPGFTGYIGKLTYYRNTAVEASKIPFPSPYHPMFELGLMRREDKCKEFISWVNRLFLSFRQSHQNRQWRESCHPYFFKFLNKMKYAKSKTDICMLSDEPPSWYHKDIYRIIEQQAFNKPYFSSVTSNVVLFKWAERLVDGVEDYARKWIKRDHADPDWLSEWVTAEKGLRKVKKAVPILKQSACLGNNDAMYMLSVILNNGIAVRADEIQAQAYLMLALLGKHRLSSLALGHKHRNGLDGVPKDEEQAYTYYKYVADTTRQDKEQYKDTDVFTESIRLTDEEQVKQQTDEDGDIFHWLKHQAQKGVFSAQRNIGRMLFWGSQGLKRNIGAALEYLRMGAETQDPQAMYDYGIILLRGHGTEVNKTEAMTHLKKSAEKKNPAALNALGWYALNHEHNVTAAVQYFEESYRLGSPDAAFNLGILHLTGGFLDKVVDADKALTYFNFAGVRNQIDAGIQIASLNMKGTSKMTRNIYIGIEWARFIAEKNPVLGLVLRKAIKAFRNYDMQTSMLYYMMAGDAGIEVGSFNSAYLCEDNQDGMTSLVEKDCQWRNYNITTLREEQFVNPYALIKMGDYYWYGCGHYRDVDKAADFYTRAAVKGDPHAIFNLGFMLEEGAYIKDSIWTKLGIPRDVRRNTEDVLKTLYTRCKDSRQTEAYLPCSIALYKIQMLQWWKQYEFMIQIISFICVAIVTVLSARSIYNHITGQNQQVHQLTTQL